MPPKSVEVLVKKHSIQLINNAKPAHNNVFCTITLPKRFYSKKSVMQYKNSRPWLKTVLQALFSEVHIVAELTKKSNIHYHMIGCFRDGLAESEDATVKLHRARDILKGYHVIGDIQYIKYKDKVVEYMLKDVKVTAEVLGCSPIFGHYAEPASKEEVFESWLKDLDPKPLDTIICE